MGKKRTRSSHRRRATSGQGTSGHVPFTTQPDQPRSTRVFPVFKGMEETKAEVLKPEPMSVTNP